MPQSLGEQAAQQNQTPPTTPRFDPAALLNPRSAPKRPALSGEEVKRGRAESISPGQVSLVERLHNVQERTASPAKRIKTTDEQQRKKVPSNSVQFGSNSALDLRQNGHTSVPGSAQVDLTMSVYSTTLRSNFTDFSQAMMMRLRLFKTTCHRPSALARSSRRTS